jgi:cytoskeletal protein CcmA (bactofilin family)
MCHNAAVACVGDKIFIRGEVESAEDLLIQGRIEGPVWTDGLSVTVAQTASVIGDIVARVITVLGTVEGTLIGVDRVDVGPTACVRGRVLAERFVLADGASFNGAVHPQHLVAALTVARHRHVKLPGGPPNVDDSGTIVRSSRS